MHQAEIAGKAEKRVELRREQEAPHDRRDHTGDSVRQKVNRGEDSLAPAVRTVQEEGQSHRGHDHDRNLDHAEVEHALQALPVRAVVQQEPVVGPT